MLRRDTRARTRRAGERDPGRRARLLAIALTLMSVGSFVLAACGGDDDATRSADAGAQPRERAQTAAGGQDRIFVGKLEGTDANIAVIIQGGTAHAYLCDSKKIWGFASGTADGKSLALRSDRRGYTLEAKLDDGMVSGSVMLANTSTHSFTARPATTDAGLYQLARVVDGTPYVTHWVKANDGSVRGKTTVATTSQPAGTEATAEATAGAGAESVPPAAEPAPEPLAFKGRKCRMAIRAFNDFVSRMNAKGGIDKMTKDEVGTFGTLHDNVFDVCPQGSGFTDDLNGLDP